MIRFDSLKVLWVFLNRLIETGNINKYLKVQEKCLTSLRYRKYGTQSRYLEHFSPPQGTGIILVYFKVLGEFYSHKKSGIFLTHLKYQVSFGTRNIFPPGEFLTSIRYQGYCHISWFTGIYLDSLMGTMHS